MKLETPKPNQTYYKLYFLLGLLTHPRRLVNLLKVRMSGFTPNVNYLPTVMDIEPTQACNYRCVMCIRFADQKRNMSFSEFKRIIDEQVGLMEVKIQGVGEPLLNKDFFQMIDYAMGKRLWVRTTTNGSLLHLNDNYKKLVDTGIHDINISIDGATKEVYEAIRVGGEFERVVENCRLINEYNAAVKKTTVRAWVVLQDKNKHQFFDFPKFFADLGFQEMCLSFAMHNYGREGRNAEEGSFAFSDEEFAKLFDICQRVGILPTFFFHPSFTGERFCQIPFKRVYVTTDSHILPCCYIANPEVVDFGPYDKFKDIWFNKYVDFRRSMRTPECVPEFCRVCYGGNGQ